MNLRSIITAIAALAITVQISASTADISKVRYIAGEGTSAAAVVMRWNDCDGHNMENITWGVKFDESITIDQAVKSLLAADQRFYALSHNDNIVAYGFALYTRRKQVPKMKIGSKTYNIPETGIYIDDTDNYASCVPQYSDSEHWQINNSDTGWKYFVNGVETTTGTVLRHGDILHIEYTAGDAPSEGHYHFYVPPYDTEGSVGCYVPQEMTYSTSDEVYVPFYVNAYKASKAPSTTGTNIMKLTYDNQFLQIGAQPVEIFNKKNSYYKGVPVKAGISTVTTAVHINSEWVPASPDAPFSGNVIITKSDNAISALAYEPENATVALGGSVKVSLRRIPAEGYTQEQADAEPVTVTFAGVPVSYDEATGILTPTRYIGKATMKAVVNAVRSTSATFTLNVTEPERPVTALSLGSNEIVLKNGTTMKMEPVITPSDATYTPLEWNSSATGVVSVDADGNITGNGLGTAVITVRYAYDTSVTASVIVRVVPAVNVSSIVFDAPAGTDGAIHISYMGVLALKPQILPDNADLRDFEVEIGNNDIATTYSVSAYDYILPKYPELVTHAVGTTTLQFRATDGSGIVSPVYRVTVDSPDRTPLSTYRDGIFWLNEEWYGHTNGSLNYIDGDGNVHYRAYEARNPWQSLGCTSQYATVWADKLIIMSKQASDAGDTRRGGGRVIVADATSLKRLGSQDYIGGDGRACVGVSDRKAYLSTARGITPFSLTDYTCGTPIELNESGNLYENQVGDMVAANGRVFAVMQDVGTIVINTSNDKIVTILKDTTTPQGIVRSADGNVWVGAGNRIYCYDPSTLELLRTVNIPGSITCQWSTWTSTAFFAPKHDNVLYWGMTDIYCYDIEKGTSKKVFTMPRLTMKIGGTEHVQKPYGTPAYDESAGRIMLATTLSGSSLYSYAWYHFIDPSTGEITTTIPLERYYWFPSIPVVPHRRDKVIDLNLEQIQVSVDDNTGEWDLLNYTDAPDVRLCDIEYSIAPLSRADSDIADVTLNGSWLSITPHSAGTASYAVTASAEGRTATHPIVIEVRSTSNVSDIETIHASVDCDGQSITFTGCDRARACVYTVTGSLLQVVDITGNRFTVTPALAPGIYVIKTSNGITDKISIR